MKSTILIVDDIPKNLQVIGSHLGHEDFELIMATSGEAALDVLEDDIPDLILLDINLTGIDGIETCKRIKEEEKLQNIPIIFLTAKTDIDDIVLGFEVGAVDYITKPFNKAELKARIHTHLELHHLRQELVEKNRELEVLSRTDPLTKLNNRRSMMEFLRYETGRIDRGADPAGVILMDIDNFKSFNDTYGHEAGDEILKKVSQCLMETVRKSDKVARWGGEEFLVVLPETSASGTEDVAEKIRKNIEEAELIYNEQRLNITITAGCSTLIDENIDRSINYADEKLYIGKEQGKNRIIS